MKSFLKNFALNGLVLLILSFKCIQFFGQDIKQNISFISPGTNPSISNIRKILQDQYGFTWIATQDGLFRFDSRAFVSYNSSLEKKRKITGADVRDILIDSARNLLWLCSSYGGLNAINLATGNVVVSISQSDHPVLSNNLIKCLALDNNNVLLGCERGLYKLNPETVEISKIDIMPSSSDGPYIDLLSHITGKLLLISCRNYGHILYDLNSYRVLHRTEFIKPLSSSTPLLQFYNTTNNAKGQICISSSSGLNFYRLSGSKLTEDSLSTSLRLLLNANGIIVKRALYDYSGKLWISSNKGLYVFDKNDIKRIVNNDTNEPRNDWLHSIFSLYADKNNYIWLGCQNGAAYLKNDNPPFITYSVSSNSNTKINHAYFLFPLNDSFVYSAAEDGLYKINKADAKIIQLEKGKTYDFLFADPFGKIIVSNSSGLFLLHNDKIKPLAEEYKEFTLYKNTRINSAVKINDSCIAMGTENEAGILIWNFVNKTISAYNKDFGNTRLKENIINNLYLLKNNRFLILSDASLSIFNFGNPSFVEPLLLVSNRTKKNLNIFFDICRVKDTFYLASYGNGVIKLNSDLKVEGEITIKEGLSNNGVYKVLPWKDSLVFITSNSGLNLYSPASGKVKQYFKENGLNDNTFEETSGNIYKNEIFAGGINGFTAINPEQIRQNNVIHGLFINNISIEKKNRKSDTTDFLAKKFIIPNDHLQTNIYFSAINYSSPDRTTFSYKIKELHQNWINLNNQNFITLIGLSPGTYHLQVQAFNEDGIGSEIKELTLVFLPKWYQTWWFKTLVGLCIIAIGYSLYRMRISQLKKEEKIRNQLASDLHDDLGSTLNSIKVHSNLALMEKEKPEHLIHIKQGAQDAITGIRDIIWVLDDKKDSLGDMLARVAQFATPLCKAGHVTYTVEANDDILQFKLGKEEKRNLYMIIKETINNSLKYAQCKNILLKAERTGKNIRIEISDDGTGFDQLQVSSGYGLKNITSRAKAIGYTSEIITAPGNGTKLLVEKN